MADIARASVVARDVFNVRSLWADVEALDGAVPADTQYDMLLSSRRMVERSTRWLLRTRPRPLDIAAERERYGEGAKVVAGLLPGVLVEHEQENWRERVGRLTEAGVPEALAGRVAAQGALFSALDVVDIAKATEHGSRRSPRCTSRSAATCTCTGCATRSRCSRATRAGRRWRARRCATTSSRCTPS